MARNRGDGLYILPSLSGSTDFGHWTTNLVCIKNGQAVGYNLDSLGTAYRKNKTDIRDNIMRGFRIGSIANWHDIPILQQTELECGSRCIWNMIVICMGHKHHIPLGLIFDRIKNLGGIQRDQSARRVREDVRDFIVTQSGTSLF